MKLIVACLLGIMLVSCKSVPSDSLRKYDIYISDVPEQEVITYVNLMTKLDYYEAHKLLVLNKNYAEISYTSEMAPEMIVQKTKNYFGDGYTIKLNSNVIKVERLRNEVD